MSPPSKHLNSGDLTQRAAIFGRKKEKVTSEVESANVVDTTGMPDLLSLFNSPKQKESTTSELKEYDITEKEQKMAISLAGAELSLEQLFFPLAATILGTALYKLASMNGVTVEDISSTIQAFQADPTGTLQSSLDGLGPLAIVYFGALYILAELFAIPATPLTLASGYLFGFAEGAAVVLAAGTISAIIGFFIGKTFLRQWVETVLEENPQFKKLDNAIGAEGFKLLVLVRLSPIFPFSLLNYTYGASSISFPTFVAGTLLGFTPSTLGYVYTGLVGKELLLGNGSQPWYVYAGGVTLLFGFLKLVTDVATEIVEAIDDNEE